MLGKKKILDDALKGTSPLLPLTMEQLMTEGRITCALNIMLFPPPFSTYPTYLPTLQVTTDGSQRAGQFKLQLTRLNGPANLLLFLKTVNGVQTPLDDVS